MPTSLWPHDSAIERDYEPSELPSALTSSLIRGLDSSGLIYSLPPKCSKNILLTEIKQHCVEYVEFTGPSVTNMRFVLFLHGSICCHKFMCLIPPLSWSKKSLCVLVAWCHGVSRTDQVSECLQMVFYMLGGNGAWHKRESELLIGFMAITPRAAFCPR